MPYLDTCQVQTTTPNGVLGQLTICLLVQHTAADVSACLCIEQPDGSGVGDFVT